MAYIKYDATFLDALQLKNTTDAKFDAFLKNQTKSFLFRKQTPLEVGSGTSDVAYLKTEIEKAYSYLADLLFPKYDAIKDLLEEISTSETTIAQSERKVTNTYFEPVVNNAQVEVKNNGTIESADEDTTTTTETRSTQNEKLVEFYDLTNENIISVFSDFVNIYV